MGTRFGWEGKGRPIFFFDSWINAWVAGRITDETAWYLDNAYHIWALMRRYIKCYLFTRSTQPSTLRGTVSAFWLSSNKWRWWVWRVAAYRRTHGPSRPAWSESWQPTGAKLHSLDEPSELSKWLSHNDSTKTLSWVLLLLIFLYPW